MRRPYDRVGEGTRTKWGVYEHKHKRLVVATAVVPMVESVNHNKFSMLCGCGVRVEHENGVPMYIHQEARN